MVFNAVFNSISVISRQPVHLSMLPRVLLTSTPYNIVSKPLAAFPRNYCLNQEQWWERNESCRNDYHQSSERILTEPRIEPATSCSQVRNATGWAMGLGTLPNSKSLQTTIFCLKKMVVSSRKGRKHSEKRKNCLLRQISPIPTEFTEALYCGHVKKTRACLEKG